MKAVKSNLVIGIDPSLTGTALCGWHEDRMVHVSTLAVPKSIMKQTSKERAHIERLIWLRDTMHETIDTIVELCKAPATVINVAPFIEGYAYCARGSVFDMGELGGILRLLLAENYGWFVNVPPTSLKKFVTEKGNSPKEVMLEKTFRKYGLGSDTLKDNNQVDAYGLARFGAAFFSTNELKKYEREALEGACPIYMVEDNE